MVNNIFPGFTARGRGHPRAPLFMPRHVRPRGFDSEFVPHPYGFARGNQLNRPMRPGPLPPPRMAPPPLQPRVRPPPRPHLAPLPSDMPFYPPRLMRPPLRALGIPPRMPHRPIIRGHLRPQFTRGRGGLKSSMPGKRFITENGQPKKTHKRKEKTEESEINKPWVTEMLKSEISKKYKMYELAKEKKNESDWQSYKDQKILVAKMTNTAKLEYIGSHPEADVDQIMFGGRPKN